MKLKNKVRILEESGNIKEVAGEVFPYEYNGHTLQIIVHESEQPWTPGFLDISEATTGCRMTSTDKQVSASNKSDIKTALDLFMQDKGIRAVQAQIKKIRQQHNLTDLTR